MYLLKIHHGETTYNLPDPVHYKISFHDVYSANSGVNDSGVTQNEIVRKDVATINVEWEMLTYNEFATVMIAIFGYAELDVSYFYGLSYRRASMMVKPRDIELQVPDDTDEQMWKVSFTLEEY